MNTFSPEKVFFQAEKLIKYNKTGDIPFPSSADITISGVCNHNCYFCNNKYTHNGQFMSIYTMTNILDILDEMQCNAVCLAGGGEPTLNSDYIEIINSILNRNKKVLLVTNGSSLEKDYEKLHDTIIGISFEAATKEVYKQIRGVKTFDSIVSGIEKLASLKKQNNNEITLKTLITKYNVHQLYDITKLAFDIGVDSIFIRPVGLFRIFDKNYNQQDLSSYYLSNEDIKTINEQIEKCNKLNSSSFTVHFSNASYKEDYTQPKYEFKKCYACMLTITFSVDNGVYICVDHKHEKEWKLCDIPDTLKYFNSEFHKSLVEKIDYSLCPRCSKNKVNYLIENGILRDTFNRDFI